MNGAHLANANGKARNSPRLQHSMRFSISDGILVGAERAEREAAEEEEEVNEKEEEEDEEDEEEDMTSVCVCFFFVLLSFLLCFVLSQA